MSIAIRPAEKQDLADIVRIYNESIVKKGLTADLDQITVQDREEWFEEHSNARYPLLVASQNDQVIGWISLSPYRKGRKALENVTEVSLYIAHSHIGKGVGSDMMQCMIEMAKEAGYKNMIAILIETNERSVGLFAKYGFELWGTLPGIVEIDGQTFNHSYYGRKL